MDHNLQLIIVKSMNKIMSHMILSLKSATQIWDVVEALMEGSEKVKENKYEFKAIHGETISQIYVTVSCCCYLKGLSMVKHILRRR